MQDSKAKARTYAISNKLAGIMQDRKLSRAELGKAADIASATVSAAARGKHISLKKAAVICEGLNLPLNQVFTIYESETGLSDKTILHHHRLISAILEKAKRERIIPFNVAAEYATVPKVEHKEAQYLDDNQAREFLTLLLDEQDIRIKTALILLLFTGVRRGELCGLLWPDIDAGKEIINIMRASQYQTHNGVVEVPTKNVSSIRAIKVPEFVIHLLRQYHTWWNEHRLLFGEAWEGAQERLFIQYDGKPINPDTINFWLNKFLGQNGFKHITPHSLRHTFATLQLAAGVDIRTLQARTGHAQASTLVNIYSHG